MEIINNVKRFREYLMYCNSSPNTAENYGSAIASFLSHFSYLKEPKEITAQMIIEYCLKFDSLYTRRNAHSAIKRFYKFKSKHGESSKFRYIVYPKKPNTIPDHVTPHDFIKLMQSCNNLKHKCVLMFGFDAGFRVSEVINIKLKDINFDLMQLNVRQSKEKKDRVVKLTRIFAELLISYIEQFNPTEYVFNGQFDVQYSVRSCQEILTKTCIKAGVKHYKYHALRHGFSMSLYENGEGLADIGLMLGHSSRQATEIYAKKNNKIIQGIESPVELLFKEHGNLQLNR